MAGSTNKQRAPATTPEAREDQLTALALNAMEKRVREGKATGPELVYLAKLGSVDNKLDRELKYKHRDLMTAKTEQIESAKRVEELYSEAIAALKDYGGIRDD
jgi:hypothetical protein